MLTSAPRPSSVEKDNDSREEKVVSESSEEGIDFGGESRLPPPPVLTSEQEAKLWRKIDLRLMPILRYGPEERVQPWRSSLLITSQFDVSVFIP